jgi:hypothetical protein
MDKYRCYLSARVQIFKSSGHDSTGENPYLLGASSGLSDGDLDGYASCDGDGVTFSFHTSLVCELDVGGVGSSFTGSLVSLGSSSSHLFHWGWFS